MRTLQILRALLPLVLSGFRDRKRYLFVGSTVPRTAAFHQARATRIVATLGTLGPTFVKFGQLFAGRADLLSEPYVRAFSSLTDRVPPVPVEAVEQVIRESYGRSAEEIFERFDREPIAAASLGQVHRARYGGEEVVVKVLRPGVQTLVARDIASARRILGWVRRWFDHAHVRGMLAAVDEFALRVVEEMDFRMEAAHAVAIRANFAGNRRIRVPLVVAELVRERVLVLEYMEGTRIDALDPQPGSGARDPDDVLSRVLELYIQMMLVDGLFHADPHPGNLLVAPDGALILLDFGMVVKVERERRRQILETSLAAIRQDADGVVRGFQQLGMLDPSVNLDTIRSLATALLALTVRQTTAQERIQYLSNEIMTTLYDWPVVLPGDLVYFARTAALIEGLGVRYNPRFNAVTVAAPILLRNRARILRALGDTDPAHRPDWATSLGTFLGRAAKIASRAGRELATLVGETALRGGR
jgi:predicted unusual protein kinase regulating ubiquinone biosynthesis (AarF/ABC1/UbiB family)